MNCENVYFSFANQSVHDAVWAIDGLADILTFELRNDASCFRIGRRILDGTK